MAQYRWNRNELAVGYDEAAVHIHPHYREVQDQLLGMLRNLGPEFTVLDVGGGSGRLIERVLGEFPAAQGMILDQSESFLEIARNRLRPFGSRATYLTSRLQDDWTTRVGEPNAIVSMSAIHHLDADEKQACYQRCFAALVPGGVFLNGDEVRDEDDGRYRRECEAWVTHMHQIMSRGLVPEPMHEALHKWEERNLKQFGHPKSSGDDCHESAQDQCRYLEAAGFADVTVQWQKGLWAVFGGRKP